MRIFLNNSDWQAILFDETGFPTNDQEIIERIIFFASHEDIKVILTENDKPIWLLTYDKIVGEFLKNKIDEY